MQSNLAVNNIFILLWHVVGFLQPRITMYGTTNIKSQHTVAETVTETSLVELNRDAAQTDTFVLRRIPAPI